MTFVVSAFASICGKVLLLCCPENALLQPAYNLLAAHARCSSLFDTAAACEGGCSDAQQAPLAMDVSGVHLIVASAPLDITVFRIHLTGALTPQGAPAASFTLVRQLSIMSVGHPLQVSLQPPPTCLVHAAVSGALREAGDLGSDMLCVASRATAALHIRWQ